jgi:hypothetical protein
MGRGQGVLSKSWLVDTLQIWKGVPSMTFCSHE